MFIRPITVDDLPTCAEICMAAYNGPPWEDHWEPDAVLRYLGGFLQMPRAFTALLYAESGDPGHPGGEPLPVACVFAHERTWWTQDEIFVDELFVAPAWQRMGYGHHLIDHLEAHIRAQGFAGFTLLTNRHMPAYAFYQGLGFVTADHVRFMYRVTPRGGEQPEGRG